MARARTGPRATDWSTRCIITCDAQAQPPAPPLRRPELPSARDTRRQNSASQSTSPLAFCCTTPTRIREGLDASLNRLKSVRPHLVPSRKEAMFTIMIVSDRRCASPTGGGGDAWAGGRLSCSGCQSLPSKAAGCMMPEPPSALEGANPKSSKKASLIYSARAAFNRPT